MSDEAKEPTEEDIRKFEEVRIELEEGYYSAVGKGISSWSRTESFLVDIAAMLLDTEHEKAGLILYSITGFYTWLSIVDELFALDPSYRPLRSNWTAIETRLKKLNDTRVRLAHHAVERGAGIESILAREEVDEETLLPSVRPSQYDARTKSKKHSPLKIEQILEFINELTVVIKMLSSLHRQMAPIYLEPKRKLVAKMLDLQQKAGVVNPKLASTAGRFLERTANYGGMRDSAHRSEDEA